MPTPKPHRRNARTTDRTSSGEVERRLFCETCLARSSNGSTCSNRLETQLCSMTLAMLLYLGHSFDFCSRCAPLAVRTVQHTNFSLNQATVNDIEKYEFVAESIEVVSRCLCRCRILEQLYVDGTAAAAEQLESALIRLYSAILLFLSKLKSYFNQSKAGS